MNKKKKITPTMQTVACDILTQFLFTRNMDEVVEAYSRVLKEYELCEDPFTHTPCTFEEYCKNSIEYEKQVMIERYGHCDGLE
jgi:hypothetical protein